MAKKLGDVAIAVTILAFIVIGFSSFINSADSSLGVSSGVVGSGLSGLKSNLSSSDSFVESFRSDVDDTSSAEADPAQQLETRGDAAADRVNLFSKNILIGFFHSIGGDLPQAKPAVALGLSLLAILITVLILRFWRGDGKI